MIQIRSVLKCFESTFRPGGFWFNAFFIFSVVVVVVAGTYFTLENWNWLQAGTDTPESNSTTLRNIGLMTGGMVALVFALWRSIVAGHQADIARRQAEETQRQVELIQDQVGIAQQGLLNERYQRGADMLGSETIAVRLGGIYALRNLAEEHPEQYYIQVMGLLAVFVHHTTRDNSIEAHENLEKKDDNQGERLREDVNAIVDMIRNRSETFIALEKRERFKLYLYHANLPQASLWDTNLSGAGFWDTNLFNAFLKGVDLSDAYLVRTNLSGAYLWDANLSNAEIWSVNLSGAELWGANLSDARIRDVNLSGTQFVDPNSLRPSPARGLTQSQLDHAHADPDNPPILEGVLDAETGEPLVWRGKPLDD